MNKKHTHKKKKKHKKWLVNDVMYSAATHTRQADDVTDLVKTEALMAVLS